MLRRELVQRDPTRRRGVADLGRRQSRHLEETPLVDERGRHPRTVQALAQLGGLRRSHVHDLARRLSHELVDADVGDQPTTPDHDHLIRRQRHLAHQMRGDEHRPALRRQAPEEVPDPVDAFRVEAVDRLVEDQRLGIAEQRAGNSEPLAHAERELAGALVRHLA